MKKIKIVLIVLILLVIIVITTIMVNKNNNDKVKGGIGDDITIGRAEKVFANLNSYQEYYNTEYCIDLYFNSLEELANRNLYIDYYGYTEEQYQEQVKSSLERTYAMLGNEFKSEFNITINNIYEFYKDYKKCNFYITEMYIQDITINVSAFIVYGKRIDIETNQVEDYGFLVKTDKISNTFKVYPYEYLLKKGYQNIKIGDTIKFIEQEEIKNDIYNMYKNQVVDDEKKIETFFEIYKSCLIHDIEKAYDFLDIEYREKRFGTFDNFKNYVEKNINTIKRAQLDKYQKGQGNYNEYICIDNNGNYYIFNETAVMNFSVILDTYTIDFPEFIQKYNSTNEQGKVALNIDKFIQAINNQDYKYAYNCLADSYKNNYFKTQEEFEVYAAQNFYENSTVDYKNFDIQGGVYTYSVILKNEQTGEQMNKTFIMQLGEETDFALSFDK